MPGRVTVSQAPRFSSQSNPAETHIRIVEEEFRTLRSQIEQQYGVHITPEQPIWPWLMRHAGWCAARFRVRSSGNTPFFDAYGHNYSGMTVPAGET
eukprot:12714849-Alexandrium_andersonii.AAC.1